MSLADSVRSNFGSTFSDDLRARTDSELEELFRLRPDLINPIPADINSLATRSTSAPSLIRAIETLNLFQLQILESTTLFEDAFTVEEVVELTDKAARKEIEHLVSMGLLYKDGDKLRISRAVRDILGENVAGLGPTIAQRIDFTLLKKAPIGALELLEQLTWGPPKGELNEAVKSGSAVEWLLKNKF
ncbi:MAG: hypothetical protein ACKO5V_00970, partial [Actinomycetota bacterium]